MKRNGPARRLHRVAGLLGALGLLVLTLTGLALLHPEWLGRKAAPAAVVSADPFVPGRLLRAAPFLLEESLDDGATWRDLPCGLVPAAPVALRHDPADSGVVWLLGTTELLVARDGGVVWTPVALPAAVGFDEPARDLALPRGGAPLLTSDRHGWRRIGDDWREQWHAPPTQADALHRWVRRLHTGHWGPPLIARLYDAAALIVLATLVTGIALFRRRNGNGNGRKP